MLLAGAGALGKRLISRVPWAPALVLTVVITAFSLADVSPAIGIATSCDRSSPLEATGCFSPAERAFMAAAAYARDRTPATTRFVTSKEDAFGYHSNRKLVSIGSVLRNGPEGIIGRMKEENVSYMVIGTGTGRDYVLRNALRLVCDKLQVVQFFQPQAAIFAVLPDRQTVSDGAACSILTPPKGPNVRGKRASPPQGPPGPQAVP